MKKTVVITGSSSGIGLATATLLVRKGFEVFGTVRAQADAARLQAQLGSGFTPLLMDLNDRAALERGAARVREALGQSTLSGLINNAGITVLGPLLHLTLDDFRRQIETNLVAPLSAIQSFAALLGADRARHGAPGRIVNISSLGGRTGPPFLGAYAASKHGLEGLSESLRRELLLYGIEVIIVEPGYVVTPILEKVEAEDLSAYDASDYADSLSRFTTGFLAAARDGLAPGVVAEAVYSALTTPHPKLRYTLVKHKFSNWTLPRLLPRRRVDRAMGRQLGLLFK